MRSPGERPAFDVDDSPVTVRRNAHVVDGAELQGGAEDHRPESRRRNSVGHAARPRRIGNDGDRARCHGSLPCRRHPGCRSPRPRRRPEPPRPPVACAVPPAPARPPPPAAPLPAALPPRPPPPTSPLAPPALTPPVRHRPPQAVAPAPPLAPPRPTAALVPAVPACAPGSVAVAARGATGDEPEDQNREKQPTARPNGSSGGPSHRWQHAHAVRSRTNPAKRSIDL